ncbi:5-bromo-4-chloroindolyl phosphate hydrolysis family protein [Bacillus alveayuensis]|uniref:5-bromo-4-chloroindolyl phosphate hydrolysis family protein n=1 Tax=Aeribacillus alveayuensis TaxID=279215 RepID=UPI0005D11900|nr:5-bromo-4-chloroindolyl phosphate hydrolysis family protein [Bacillus alveayuensis]
MRSIFSFLIRSIFSFLTMVISWFIIFFAFNASFFLSVMLSLMIGFFVFLISQLLAKQKLLKTNGLSRREYAYIHRNLKEAKQKQIRLQRTLFKARTIDSWKILFDINRLSRRIYQIVKNEPKRFYQGEKYFYYHLDSCVELSEKYVQLASQPIKDADIRHSLEVTKKTLRELNNHLEKDLIDVLSNDLNDLKWELDFAKKQTDKSNVER